MKKGVTREVDFCDFCGEECGYPHACSGGCGKVACYECEKNRLRQFHATVFFDSSVDPAYCPDCLRRLMSPGRRDDLLEACRQVESLRDEHASWWARFQERMEAAEAAVEKARRA